jgi:uncharacterized protein (TIRG00374 family)
MKKRYLALILGLAAFSFLLWKLDIQDAWATIRSIRFVPFAVALALIGFTQYLSYYKWKVMYDQSARQSRHPLLPIYCSVVVGGMVTPARSGDIFASLAWKEMQGKVLAWSIFNRILEGMTTLILSFVILAIFFSSTLSGIQAQSVLIFFGLAILAILLIFSPRIGAHIFESTNHLLRKFDRSAFAHKILSYEEKIQEQITSFYETTAEFKRAHKLLLLVAITLVARGFSIAGNYWLFYSLGMNLSMNEVLGVLAVTWISSFLSPTPSGIGVGDIAPSVMLTQLGHKASAGGFLIINRMIDLSLILFWSALWSFYKSKPQDENKLEPSHA